MGARPKAVEFLVQTFTPLHFHQLDLEDHHVSVSLAQRLDVTLRCHVTCQLREWSKPVHRVNMADTADEHTLSREWASSAGPDLQIGLPRSIHIVWIWSAAIKGVGLIGTARGSCLPESIPINANALAFTGTV